MTDRRHARGASRRPGSVRAGEGASMLHVGTSGWQYRDWRGRFYPDDVAQHDWLAHYARRFATVEVDSTFYRLPGSDTFATWAAAVSGDFRFALKASRYLTHVKRLRDPDEPVGRFLEHAAPLGERLGPVLLQLPPTLRIETERLASTLRAFPGEVRVAVEPRHDSWLVDELFDLLADHDAAFVLADRGSRPITPLRRTASWGYVRLHEGRASPSPCYGRTALRSWAHRIADLYGPRGDVYVYCNNDTHACAPRDAARLASLAERAGLQPTRVPAWSEIDR